MKDIPPFKIDKWMQEYVPQSQLSLTGSNVRPLTLNELQNISADSSQSIVDLDLPLSYGALRGSKVLRERIAEIHSSETVKLSVENVLITPGSVMANYLTLTNLCGPGDHVICQYPTFAQLYEIPRYQGAEISLWRMKRENNWEPQLDELEAMIRPNTKVIIINNPANPTGTVLQDSTLTRLIGLAKKFNIVLYSDEVFRPLFHSSDPPPPSMASLGYSNSVTTGSVSKAHGLPGIRVGWVVSQNLDLLERIMTARDYTTISVSVLDDSIAASALSEQNLSRIMKRNLDICQKSLVLFEDFARKYSAHCDWVRPLGGGTVFLRILEKGGKPVDGKDFARFFIEKESVCLLPGDCFADGEDEEMHGWFRLLLGDDEKVKTGLEALGRCLENK